ncbi:MAG: DUF4407 domain-containing protein [Bacteroidetes bacterium]|nr:DUF4407 domain-containing protein [Bacteroidota bacterium]
MNKVYSYIIGLDPQVTSKYQPESKRKIALLATCLLVPVILWFISTFLLVHHVLAGTGTAALTAALTASFIIFLIERSIILANSSKVITAFRVVLGMAIAIIGSICIDEVIFKNDIDNKVAEYQHAYVASAGNKTKDGFKEVLREKATVKDQKYKAWQKALKEAKGEADGSSGSGIAKVGQITKLKLSIAKQLEQEYRQAQTAYDNKVAESNKQAQTAISEAATSFNGNALLLRIKAMFDLIKENSFMRFVYIVFTILLVMLEFLVVIIKLTSKPTVDEELEMMRNQLLKAKGEKTLNTILSHYQAEEQLPQVANAQKLLKELSTAVIL